MRAGAVVCGGTRVESADEGAREGAGVNAGAT